MGRAVGLDFGTTNSAIGVTLADGTVSLARFKNGNDVSRTIKSVIYFSNRDKKHRDSTAPFIGAEAIEQYLEAEIKGRLLQSVKSYLPSRLFSQTQIFGRNYSLEELIALILRHMLRTAVAEFGEVGETVVLGRPVRFAGAESEEDEQFALNRLRSAAELAGFKRIFFEFEPIAAAYEYEKQLTREELVMIADFGGGTSDFTLIRLGAGREIGDDRQKDVLGTAGIGIAGDAFDGKLVRHAVAPKLGLGTHYRSLGKELPVPAWLFSKIEGWHQVSFLKTPQTLKVIRDVKVQALEPEKVGALLHIVANDLGYNLYRAVEKTKLELSQVDLARFNYRDSHIEMEEEIFRSEFETWIDPDIQRISGCIDRLLSDCNVTPAEVGSIFLTGGTSFVPKVREVFANKFGADRLRGGEELTSVAKGLALCAADK
jgi:hypothetical chaperone protein